MRLSVGPNSGDLDVSSNNGDADYWVVKVDAFGSFVWEKNYGGK